MSSTTRALCLLLAVARSLCSSSEEVHLAQCEATCLKYHVVPGVSPGCVDLDMWINKCKDAHLTSSCRRPIRTYKHVNNTFADTKAGMQLVCEKIFYDETGSRRPLVILTSVHKPYAFFELLVESAVRLNLHVVVLGWDATPKAERDGLHQVRYFGYKVVAIAHLLHSCSSLSVMNDDQVVMFLDGADAFFQQGQAYMLDAFRKMGHPIVFSVEESMMPNTVFSQKGYETKYRHSNFSFVQNTPYKYLNSGGWIARAGAMRVWIKEWINSPFVTFNSETLTPLNPQPARVIRPVEEIWKGRHEPEKTKLFNIYKSNDQWHAAHMFQAGVGDVWLDFSNSVFVAMHLSKPFDQHITVTNKHPTQRVRVVHSGTVPAVVHYNGGAKWWHCADYDPIKIGGFTGTKGVSQSELDKHFLFFDTDLNLVTASAEAIVRTKPIEIKCEGAC